MPEQVEEIATPAAASEVEEQAKPAAASEPASTEGEQETDEQRQERKLQRKFDKLTARVYQKDLELAEMRGRLASQPATAAKPAVEEDLKPDINKWTGTYEELIAAISRWEARQEYKQLSAKEREETAKADREERERETVETYRERMNEFVKDHDDFAEVVNSAKLAEAISGPVQIAIVEDEHGPELAYYLGQNPEFCAKLNDMTSAGAVKAIGRLSERLFPEQEEEEEDDEEKEIPLITPAKPKAAVQAPAPIKPVRKPSPTSTGLDDNLPIDEWVKRREAQLRK